MEKFYIVPASIIESNFPDDLEELKKSCAVVETSLSVEDLAKKVVGV